MVTCVCRAGRGQGPQPERDKPQQGGGEKVRLLAQRTGKTFLLSSGHPSLPHPATPFPPTLLVVPFLMYYLKTHPLGHRTLSDKWVESRGGSWGREGSRRL